MNLPNKLSIIRIFLVPLIIIVELFPYHLFNFYFPIFTIYGVSISLKNIIVLILFCIASLTDLFDGYLARKNKLITSFGKFIDPVADKALINTMLIILSYNRVIPVLPVIIMIFRDIVIDGCRMVAGQKGVVVAANFYGKLKTVSQIITIIIALINNFPFEIWGIQAIVLMSWFTAFISLFSGIHYFNQIKDYIFESF